MPNPTHLNHPLILGPGNLREVAHPRHALSLSIPDEDIRFLDNFARDHGIGSRSAAVQHSIALLREAELGSKYEAAWDEWYASEDAALWDSITGDGMTDEEG